MRMLQIAAFCLLCATATAQSSVFDSANLQRLAINRKGMYVLGSWALLNIGSGIIGQRQTSGEQKHFYRMNTIWGSVNLVLAGISYFQNRQSRNLTLAESFQKQAAAEKIFLSNAALDLGYVAFGLYTSERGNRFMGEKKDRLRGTGRSLMLQGTFLAVFDGVMYLLHTKNGSGLRQSLSGLSFGQAGNGVGIIYRF